MREVEKCDKILLANVVWKSGRIVGRQAETMPMLHSTSIHSPAGTEVPAHDQSHLRKFCNVHLQVTSVILSSVKSGIRITMIDRDFSFSELD